MFKWNWDKHLFANDYLEENRITQMTQKKCEPNGPMLEGPSTIQAFFYLAVTFIIYIFFRYCREKNK